MEKKMIKIFLLIFNHKKRNEDNIGAFLESFEEIAKRFNENKQNALKSVIL